VLYIDGSFYTWSYLLSCTFAYVQCLLLHVFRLISVCKWLLRTFVYSILEGAWKAIIRSDNYTHSSFIRLSTDPVPSVLCFHVPAIQDVFYSLA
jgi:hypothetical protein